MYSLPLRYYRFEKPWLHGLFSAVVDRGPQKLRSRLIDLLADQAREAT